MFKNEHELFMPVFFDSCLRYDSCQCSFGWAAVCYEQITLLSMKGENQPETLMGFGAKRVETSSKSQFPACFLWKKLFSLTSQWHKAENSGKLGWSTSALDVWDLPKTLIWSPYEIPILLMDPSHHWCVSSQQVRGRCPQQCVHLGSSPGKFRNSIWRDFSLIFWSYSPNTLTGKMRAAGQHQEWWLLMLKKGGIRTDHWE